jgi:hypothetical protein
MDEKKPRKKIHSDFSGMKKEIKRRRKKLWTILEVHEGKTWNVRVSKKDNVKFMQVRDGETRKSGKAYRPSSREGD